VGGSGDVATFVTISHLFCIGGRPREGPTGYTKQTTQTREAQVCPLTKFINQSEWERTGYETSPGAGAMGEVFVILATTASTHTHTREEDDRGKPKHNRRQEGLFPFFSFPSRGFNLGRRDRSTMAGINTAVEKDITRIERIGTCQRLCLLIATNRIPPRNLLNRFSSQLAKLH
jgi:hypothetical protein